jgi:Skp family chaperone for outer membrane proteins
MLLLFALNVPLVISASESKSVTSTAPVRTENKMSEEEAARLTKRIEEIRAMDKSNLTASEKRELRKEVKGIKEKVKRDGGYIYIGAGTLLVIILILLLI